MAEVETLGAVAPQFPELVVYLGRIDPFRDGMKPEVVCQVDRGADDHGVILVAGHSHHKRFVDLDLLGGKALVGFFGGSGGNVTGGHASGLIPSPSARRL